jgi:hypothetical protein
LCQNFFIRPQVVGGLLGGTLPPSAEDRVADVCGGKRLLILAHPLSCLKATNLQEGSYAICTNFHACLN